MQFTLFSTIFSLFVLTTFVYSAPTSRDTSSATLLSNALEAQQLNAQFANNTLTGPCNDGDTTCIQGAIGTCVNGQFDTSQGNCPATQQCFALPSVTASGIIIACTSERNAASLIEAAGATGGITGSDPDSSTSTTSASSSTSSTGTSTSTDSSITSTSTALNNIVTVTQTIVASGTTTLPLSAVTQTLTPDEATSLLASLLAQDNPTTTATSSTVTATVTATVSATGTDIPAATPDSNNPNDVPSSSEVSSTVPTSATSATTSSASPSATPVDIVNTTASPTSLGSANGGYR